MLEYFEILLFQEGSIAMGFLFYFIILFFACMMLELVRLPVNNSIFIQKRNFSKKRFLLFLFLISPIVLIYTLRYSIGTDYFAYKKIFSELHFTTLSDYISLHKQNIGSFYVEPVYFILNRYFSFSYGSLLFVVSVLIFAAVYYGSISVKSNINLAFVVFIYFCTQFIYSMNGVRFAISIAFVFLGVQYIINKNFLGWSLCILLAIGFHKTAVICLPLFLCANFKSIRFSKLRDIIWFSFVLLFPIFTKVLIGIASGISMFSRYFTVGKYALGNFSFKPMFLFHIVPVFLPLIIVKKNFIIKDGLAKLLFRISLFEIPLRELGSFNTWLSRLARFPQMFQLIFVPYVLQSVKNSKLRLILKIYFIVWYLFYFMYTALINDAGDSLPYISIFANGGNW